MHTPRDPDQNERLEAPAQSPPDPRAGRVTEADLQVVRDWLAKAEAAEKANAHEKTRASLSCLTPPPSGSLSDLRATIDRQERKRKQELRLLERKARGTKRDTTGKRRP